MRPEPHSTLPCLTVCDMIHTYVPTYIRPYIPSFLILPASFLLLNRPCLALPCLALAALCPRLVHNIRKAHIRYCFPPPIPLLKILLACLPACLHFAPPACPRLALTRLDSTRLRPDPTRLLRALDCSPSRLFGILLCISATTSFCLTGSLLLPLLYTSHCPPRLVYLRLYFARFFHAHRSERHLPITCLTTPTAVAPYNTYRRK